MSKTVKIFLGLCVVLVAITTTLAFIPHYACACGPDVGKEKVYKGSLLMHILGQR